MLEAGTSLPPRAERVLGSAFDGYRHGDPSSEGGRAGSWRLGGTGACRAPSRASHGLACSSSRAGSLSGAWLFTGNDASVGGVEEPPAPAGNRLVVRRSRYGLTVDRERAAYEAGLNRHLRIDLPRRRVERNRVLLRGRRRHGSEAGRAPARELTPPSRRPAVFTSGSEPSKLEVERRSGITPSSSCPHGCSLDIARLLSPRAS